MHVRATGIDEHSVVLTTAALAASSGSTSRLRRRWSTTELQGIGRDITDRWRAENALRQKEISLREAYERIRSLAHRLILAQEAERTEIARDLHDDVSQQLAALGIGLSLVEDTWLIRIELQTPEVSQLRQMASGLAEKRATRLARTPSWRAQACRTERGGRLTL